jgi:hypothetical protein
VYRLVLYTLPQTKFYRLIIITMTNARPIEKWTRFWMLVTLWETGHIGRYVSEKCLCYCWTIKWITRNHLKTWASKSCWCNNRRLASERWSKSKVTHGKSWSKMYSKYQGILERCYNSESIWYENYWGRGIKCEWESFEDFYRDMWESYEAHVKEYWDIDTTIDRIDVNGNYCKENCRWATRKEQCNNRRNNTIVTYKGETDTLSNLCNKYWLDYILVINRLMKWWTLEDAFEIPKVPKSLITKPISEIKRILKSEWILLNKTTE